MPIGHFSQIIRSLMCLRFGMPTTINYLFVPNGKLVFSVSQYLSILGYSMPTCYENSRNRDSLDSCHRCPKNGAVWFNKAEMGQKAAGGMINQ